MGLNYYKYMAKKATLFDPKTGERKAVEIGSPGEKYLFSQGYQLETKAPALPTTFEKPGQKPIAATSGTPQASQLFGQGYTPVTNTFQYTPKEIVTPPAPSTVDVGEVPNYQSMKDFQLAKMKLLTQAQQGFSVSDLINRQMELRKKEIESQQKGMKTEGALQFATPSQQVAVAGAKAAPYSAQFAGVKEALQGREAQFNIFKDLFQIADETENNLINQQQAELQNKMAIQKQTMDQIELLGKTSGYQLFKNLPSADVTKLEQLSGLPTGTLAQLADAQVNNSDYQITTTSDASGNFYSVAINKNDPTQVITTPLGKIAKGFKASAPNSSVDWGQIDNDTNKTPEQAFLDMGIDQSIIDMAKTVGLKPKDLF